MGKFVIVADVLSKSEADALTVFIRDDGLGYWHWVDNAWLVETEKYSTAGGLYKAITTKFPAYGTKTLVVLKVDDPRSYFGRAAQVGWDWLSKHHWGTGG